MTIIRNLIRNPYAKAIAPIVLSVVAMVIQWIETGVFTTSELTTILFGLATGGTVFAVGPRQKGVGPAA